MAAKDAFQAHEHQIRQGKFGGQQKKEELEREVDVLRKMLDHEEKVHEFLERVHQRQDGSSSSTSTNSTQICIPNFIPSKMRELLVELAMVENEITRLESQISQLQADMKLQKDMNSGASSNNPNHHHQWEQQPSPKGSNAVIKERVAFETKALHFISKAIKGDYNLSDFSINGDNKVFKSKGSSSSSHHHQKEIIISPIDQEEYPIKSVKKSGILKPSSPMREPRHSTPRRDRNLETHADLPPKSISAPQIASEEESIHKWAPNKLSENIMKCLLLIFVRLLRTSRTMELEKSGPISRSTNFSLSFRAEPILTIKSGLLLQKDSRQQDPYGIFDSEESITRDIGPYKNLIIFTTSSMDPKCISNSSSLPLFQKLKILLKNLQEVDLRHMNYHQKLAFWINMYNACIMHAFLQQGLPSNSSPEKLLTLLNKATLNIGGTIVAAQAIEHSILRKPTPPLTKEVLGKKGDHSESNKLRERFGFEPSDPNVTFALCCGTRSSPAVKIYTAEGVVAELEKSKLEYLQASIIVMSTRRVAIPEHLLVHINDFAEDVESLIEWVCHQLPTSGSLRKSIVDCFRGISIGKASSIIDKIPYDFEFQYLLPM